MRKWVKKSMRIGRESKQVKWLNEANNKILFVFIVRKVGEKNKKNFLFDLNCQIWSREGTQTISYYMPGYISFWDGLAKT